MPFAFGPTAAERRSRSDRQAFINELLAANSSIPLAADGGRNSDFVELFNGGNATLPLLG